MSDEELIDVLDDQGRHVGVADRATVHAEGLWHQVFHILLVADRGGVPHVVLQQRALDKATFPGLLDLSATGHLAAGEQPRDGVRELREELGIELDPASLVPLGVRRIVDEFPGGLNRELVHVFLARDDRPLADLAPDPREVAAVVDLPIAAGLDLVAGRRAAVRCRARLTGSGEDHEIDVAAADLVPEAQVVAAEPLPAGYWTVLLVMAERFAAGDRRLAI